MKKILVYLISALISFTPAYVWASAAEQWTIEEVVYDNIGKNLDYTAKKVGTASNDLIYKARVPVTASATGSTAANMVRLGLAGAAIYGIVEAAGWIIENGLVKKPDPDQILTPPGYEYLWQSEASQYQLVTSLSLACPTVYNAGYFIYHIKSPAYNIVSIDTVYCLYYNLSYPDHRNFDTTYTAHRVKNPNYNPVEAPRFVPVPGAELGQEIIESPNAPQVLPDIYNPNNPAGGEAPSKTREALDNANPEPETQPQGESTPKPNSDTDDDGVLDTVDPNSPSAGDTFELPAFCEWAPAVCEFFKVQKKDNTEIKENQNKQLQQDKSFFDLVTGFFDWSKDDTELPTDETASITELPTPEITENYISWGASCPADVQIPISLQGASSTLTFSWSPWCQLLSIIRPAIVASAYIGAAFIVLGLRT